MRHVSISAPLLSTQVVKLLSALRPRHWLKNLLMLAPLVFAQAQLSVLLAAQLALGMLLMSLSASAGYLINDVLDRDADRLHPHKSRRPVAAGWISERAAIVMAISLSMASLALAGIVLGWGVALLLAVYQVMTLGYSTVLKRYIIVDVATLAALYLWRLKIGGDIAAIELSGWLVAFSASLFICLALAKRLDEQVAIRQGQLEVNHRRAYRPQHQPFIQAGIVASGALSILVLALYVGISEAAQVHYRTGEWLWLSTGFLAIWLVCITRRAARGELRGDPVLFAASDPRSLALAAATALSFITAV